MRWHLTTPESTWTEGGQGAADLLVFEARADVAELLVDAEALLLLVVAVADVADEDRQPSHPRERHLLLVRQPPPPPPLEKPQIRVPPREI